MTYTVHSILFPVIVYVQIVTLDLDSLRSSGKI